MSDESLREQIAEAIDSWWAEAEFRTAFHDGVEHIASIPLADAVLAVLGEVTVTEEWGVHGVDGLDRVWLAREEKARDHASVDIPWARRPRKLVRRTVVTTRRVGEWEEVR